VLRCSWFPSAEWTATHVARRSNITSNSFYYGLITSFIILYRCLTCYLFCEKKISDSH